MTVRFVPLDAGGEFPAGRLDELVGHLETALPDVRGPISADRVDVIVTPSQNLVPGWDLNGFAHGPHRITIGVSPTCGGKEKRPIAIQLRAVLAHELHHSVRTRGPGYGQTLGEALISEGLAQCYEEEVGCPKPNYAVAVTGVKLDTLAVNAIAELSAPHYDHPKWFFGSRDDPDFPWSGGYSLGYALVRGWLAEQGVSASRSVNVAASSILPRAFDLFERRSMT